MKTALAVAAALALVHLLASSLLGLGDAEALYYCYGRHPALSYLDHPPLVGWLNWLAISAGGPHVLAVRSVSLIAMLLSLAFTFRLTRELYGPEAAAWSSLLLLGTPVFAIGLVATTPDAPLAALWPLATWQLCRVVSDDRPGPWPRIGRPALVGLLVGLAFLAKYTGACLALGALWVAIRSPGRVWLRRPGFWLGALVALAVASPVLLWNARHAWAGALHRLVWTQTGAGLSFRNAGALVGGQLLYVGPLMLPLLLAAAWRLADDRRRDVRSTALLAASLPALGATYLLALWSPVAEPHWPAAGYMPLFPAVAGWIAGRGAKLRTLGRAAVGYGAAVLVVALVLVLTPALPALAPDALYRPEWDLANELRGWPEVAARIRALDRDQKPVLAAFYTPCSQLAFALDRDGDPPVRCVSPEIDDFDFWYGRFTLPEKGALFVTDNRFRHDPEALVPGARAIGPPVSVEVARGGRVVRRFQIYALVKKDDAKPLER